MSVRKIPLNHQNVTGIFPSRKSGTSQRFESTLEGDFLAFLEFNPEVSHFDVQPVEVYWIDSKDRNRRYTPDVLVYYCDEVGRPTTLVEVKYRDELREKWPELREKFSAAHQFAKKNGWVFRIASDRFIRTELTRTAKFLIPYVFRGPDRQVYLEELDAGLGRIGRCTVQQLLESLRSDPWKRAELIPTLWFMLGTFQVGYNPSSKITMSTALWDIPTSEWDETEIGRWRYLRQSPRGTVNQEPQLG